MANNSLGKILHSSTSVLYFILFLCFFCGIIRLFVIQYKGIIVFQKGLSRNDAISIRYAK